MRSVLASAFVVAFLLCGVRVGAAEPGVQSGTTKGRTIYVSKLGDNSDGSSWNKGLHSIQAALLAIPDDKGGHRVVVRPDTYMEANLYPSRKGAAGAYNELIGDVDGTLGSGTAGWVTIDSSDPKAGFKSHDWYGTIRAYKKGWSKEHKEESFSSNVWDRWSFRHLYATGGDAGLFFDLVDKTEPFTVVVEDCVSIGRAFGGGVASCLSRAKEPIVFRRCHLWALDWWGDTSGAYVRVENKEMPMTPDVVFEDCTMVGPQCALKGNNFGFHTSTHVKLARCRLVALNFSQPHGTPTDGVIQSVEEGKLLKVALEDCTVMGYKVFGVIVKKGTASDIQYTTTGDVKAYVQFQQQVPKGFHRLGHWPSDLFETLSPPARNRQTKLQQFGRVGRDLCEASPVIWNEKLVLLECVRPASGGTGKDHYLAIKDVESGAELSRFAEGYGLASALVHDGEFHAFASRRSDDGDWNDVTMFSSRDLKSWKTKVVIEQENEHLFNSSVCVAGNQFVMAYETNDSQYAPFSIKFATSSDLQNWTKVPGAVFGQDRYTACPCIRYVDGYYYMMYLEHRQPRWFFETYLARSSDLKTWEQSSANPVLTPGVDDGVNASDPDIVEHRGKTHLYYSVGDQQTWTKLKRAVYPGSLSDFFKGYFANSGSAAKTDSPQTPKRP
ncbi:MAG: hypothetical protein AB7O26_20345 [Planctomycetaceae bacterium]